MAQYNYRSILYTNTDNVVGLNVSQNNADLSDYSTNYRASTVKVSEITIAETTFLIDLTYAQFKAKIVSPLAWTDVKELSKSDRYELNLITDLPI